MSLPLLSRRQLITAGSPGSAALVLSKPSFGATTASDTADASTESRTVPAFLGASQQTLPPLPFGEDALEQLIVVEFAEPREDIA